jgi:cyanophycinase
MSTRPFRFPILFGWSWVHRLIALTMLLAGTGLVSVLGMELVLLSWGSDPAGEAPWVRRAGGTLMLCGGGRLPDEILDRFVELAGGRRARIVVIPTANPAPEEAAGRAVELWRARRVGAVHVLHTRSRATADDPDFVRPLTEATGVWLVGGRQSRLAEVYVETAVERQLKAVLDRGGVVAGTSAGASAMTRVMIAGGRTEPSLGRGLDLVPGAVVDQHFLRRNRTKRLFAALARHDDLIGFGIDEGTALVIHGPGHQLSVLGGSYVVACVPAAAGRPMRLEFLGREDHADLAMLRQPDRPIHSAWVLDAVRDPVAGP